MAGRSRDGFGGRGHGMPRETMVEFRAGELRESNSTKGEVRAEMWRELLAAHNDGIVAAAAVRAIVAWRGRSWSWRAGFSMGSRSLQYFETGDDVRCG